MKKLAIKLGLYALFLLTFPITLLAVIIIAIIELFVDDDYYDRP